MLFKTIKVSDRLPPPPANTSIPRLSVPVNVLDENMLPLKTDVYDYENEEWRFNPKGYVQYWLEEDDWIPIDKELPEEPDEDDWPDKYLVKVDTYGQQMAVFSEGRFWKNLAAPFENVTHWRHLPPDPKYKK